MSDVLSLNEFILSYKNKIEGKTFIHSTIIKGARVWSHSYGEFKKFHLSRRISSVICKSWDSEKSGKRSFNVDRGGTPGGRSTKTRTKASIRAEVKVEEKDLVKLEF